MAVDLTLKSPQITNREAAPPVLNNPGLGSGAVVKVAFGHLASVPAALSITSIIRLCEVPSNAVVHRVEFQAAAQGAGAFDIGVYRNNKDGGAAVDADLFATAINVASTIVIFNVTNESTGNTIAKQAQPIWQAAGMSSDPKTTLDLALTVATTAVTTGTGAVAARIWYTV